MITIIIAMVIISNFVIIFSTWPQLNPSSWSAWPPFAWSAVMNMLDPFWCHHHLPSSWSPLVWQLWRPPLNLFRSPSWQSPSPLLSWSWLSWLSWLPLVWQLWKANSSFSVIIPGFSGASGKARFSSTWGDTMNFHYWILPTRDLKIKTINNHELHQQLTLLRLDCCHVATVDVLEKVGPDNHLDHHHYQASWCHDHPHHHHFISWAGDPKILLHLYPQIGEYCSSLTHLSLANCHLLKPADFQVFSTNFTPPDF